MNHLYAATLIQGFALTVLSAFAVSAIAQPAPDQTAGKPADGATSNRVHLIWMGGNDCPPCVNWRNTELPRLQKTEVFKTITFSHVVKVVGSQVPSAFFLPENVKPLKDKLDAANNGMRGSPQWALVVNGEVFDYRTASAPSAELMEQMLLAARDGSRYPQQRCLKVGATWRSCAVKG